MTLRRITILFLLLASAAYLGAQTLNQAKAWFLEGNYEKSLPVFQQQIQVKPADGSMNFWVGVCLLQTGSVKEAIPYLEKADLKKVQQAKWYLADVYEILGNPEKAMEYLDAYLTIPNLTDSNQQAANLRKDSLQTGIERLRRVEDVLIVDSLVVPKIDMYNHFHLSKASGTLLIAHNLFPRMDFDFGHVYLPERNDRAFYADTVFHNGLDLMGRHRLLSDWGEPEALPSTVNSTADECNPFFLQDGVTLYFSSDRKGGLGGKDIYVTRLNPTTNTYVQPDLLGMPFNSPGNEYFLVIDESINRGYFATDRRNDKGHVTIYTFVPNKEKVMVSGKSLAEIQSLAEIRSIKDTWKGKNVDSILKVSAPQPKLSLDRRNVVETLIYINDSLAYYSLDEFASQEARKIMENVLSNKQVLQEKVADLEDKRIRFNSSDRSTQEKLRVEILSLENDIRQLRSDLPMLEMTARNLEIKALTK